VSSTSATQPASSQSGATGPQASSTPPASTTAEPQPQSSAPPTSFNSPMQADSNAASATATPPAAATQQTQHTMNHTTNDQAANPSSSGSSDSRSDSVKSGLFFELGSQPLDVRATVGFVRASQELGVHMDQAWLVRLLMRAAVPEGTGQPGVCLWMVSCLFKSRPGLASAAAHVCSWACRDWAARCVSLDVEGVCLLIHLFGSE